MRRLTCFAAAALLSCVACVDQMEEPARVPSPSSAPEAKSRMPVHKFGQFDPIEPAPSAASDVRIVDGDDVGCESEALGVVEATGDREQAIAALRTRAGALGAEAIMGLGERGGHFSATAVRCRDLRSGRAYDVIETIVIPVGDGVEETAFDALRARAYDLHADLIIDITREPSQVSGTAIRYK